MESIRDRLVRLVIEKLPKCNGNGACPNADKSAKVALFIKKIACDVRSANITLLEQDIEDCSELCKCIVQQLNEFSTLFPEEFVEFEEIVLIVSDTIDSIRNTISARLAPQPSSLQRHIKHTAHLSNHIVGYDQAKQYLRENVVLPLTVSEEQYNLFFHGIRSRSNVLLFGPPGSGKSCLVRAAAQEASVPLHIIYPSDILSKYQGESERSISQLFECTSSVTDNADKRILFFDEFDSLAKCRDNGDDSTQQRRLMSELLLQLSHNKHRKDLVIVAATNRIEDIDMAIQRRFDIKVYVGLPDRPTRVGILKHYLSTVEYELSDEEISQAAARVAGWSGAEIESLCRESEYLHKTSNETHESVVPLRPVRIDDIDAAYHVLICNDTVIQDNPEVFRELENNEYDSNTC